MRPRFILLLGFLAFSLTSGCIGARAQAPVLPGLPPAPENVSAQANATPASPHPYLSGNLSAQSNPPSQNFSPLSQQAVSGPGLPIPNLPPLPKTGLALGNVSENSSSAQAGPEEIDFSNFTLVLDDLSAPSGAGLQSCAILSVRWKGNGSVLSRLEACPGQDAYWVAPGGQRWRIAVYQTAPGYTHSAAWAEIAIFG